MLTRQRSRAKTSLFLKTTLLKADALSVEVAH